MYPTGLITLFFIEMYNVKSQTIICNNFDFHPSKIILEFNQNPYNVWLDLTIWQI